jgi:cell division protein ZapA
LSKEKLLTFLALGLADDLLQNMQRLEELEERLTGIASKIEQAEELTTGI